MGVDLQATEDAFGAAQPTLATFAALPVVVPQCTLDNRIRVFDPSAMYTGQAKVFVTEVGPPAGRRCIRPVGGRAS